MNDSPNRIPWWAPDGQVVTILVLIIAIVFARIANTPEIQSISYGVAVLCVVFSYLVHSGLKLIRQHDFLRPASIPKQFLERWRQLIVLSAFMLPLIVSCTANDSFVASWNPAGYWKEELEDAKKDSCDLYRDALVDSVESLQVAQRKLALGIGTTSEIKQAADGLKLMRDIHQSCITSIQLRIDRANARLTAISKQ